MVYRPKHIRTNFQMGEMPVESIVYSRLGGCFITFIQGTFFILVILALATVACFITYYATNDPSQKSQMKMLSDFINDDIAAPNYRSSPYAPQSIEPRKYIVAIQPKLNEITEPFTYTGAVYVTFVTNVDYVDSLQLQRYGVEPTTKLKVKIFRMVERNDGLEKRSASESELIDDEDDTTTMESTTLLKTEENVMTTTTKMTMTAPTTSTTTLPTSATSSTPTEATPNGYTSAREVFSNYFLKYEDRHSEVMIRDDTIDTINDTLTIRTRLSLRKDTLYVVKIEFEGNMTEIGYGFSLSSYLDETQSRRYFASTNTNSKMARPIFPTILHDRNLRIPFDVAILRRPHLTALANSKLIEQFSYRINGSEWSLATFQTTAPMRVSDLSIVVTQIAPTLITSAQLTVYAYIREKKSPNFAIVDETLAKFASAFENITDIEYYMDRINLVGIPNNQEPAIAPGMIMASENDFVRATQAADQLRRIANAALLFAKLWYLPFAQYENDYDLWLNDAMPMYLKWHALNEIYGSDADGQGKIDELFWLEKTEAFENDFDFALIKSIGINSTLNYLSEKIEKYTTNRRRSFYLLRIIERVLGSASFHRAIRTHCKHINQDEKSSLMESFQREIFDKSIDITLTKIVDTWLRTDSYPIVSVSIDVQRDEILITQQQLLPQNNSGIQRPIVLPVITRVTSNDSDGIFFIGTNTMATKASDIIGNVSWVLLNTHGLGYYRINYAPENWNEIINLLHDNITAVDRFTRATLIDDAFNLARNGYLNYSIVFELMNASKSQDTEYLTWKAILHNLKELLDHAPDFCASKIRTFAIDLISDTFQGPTDERLAILINWWRCELQMNDECSISSNEFYVDPKQITETIVKTISASNDTGDIEKTLKSISCTNHLDTSNAIFNLIFVENITRFIPNVIETCGRCKNVRKMVLENLYEDLPRVLRVTDIENLLPLFERISSEFEYKMLEDIYTKYSIYFRSELRDAFKYIVAKINIIFRWQRKIAEDCDTIDWSAFYIK